MLALGGAVPVAPYETFGTTQLADRTLESLEGHTAVLMRNHGALTWGSDLDAALDAAELLEWACTRLLARADDRGAVDADARPARGRRVGGDRARLRIRRPQWPLTHPSPSPSARTSSTCSGAT